MIAPKAAAPDAKMVSREYQLALRFHETYERLAPGFGYETRTETRAFDPRSANGRLMIAVCRELMLMGVFDAAPAASPAQPVEGEVAVLVKQLRHAHREWEAYGAEVAYCHLHKPAADMLTRLATPAADSGVREALRALVAKLDLAHADGEYQWVWFSYHNHGGRYAGPTYVAEFAAARAALAGTTTQPAATPSHSTSGPVHAGADGSAADPTTINADDDPESPEGAATRVVNKIMEQHGESLIRELKQNAAMNESGPASPQGIPLNKSEQRMLKRALFASATTIKEAGGVAPSAAAHSTGTPSAPASASPQDDALIARLQAEIEQYHKLRRAVNDSCSFDCLPACNSYVHDPQCPATNLDIALVKVSEQLIAAESRAKALHDALAELVAINAEYGPAGWSPRVDAAWSAARAALAAPEGSAMSDRFPTVQANWEHFKRVDIAPSAPEIQRHEMKRAFMAGVSSGLSLAVDAHKSGAFIDGVSKINAELYVYMTLRKAGADAVPGGSA